jgi:1-acyl-sn-glycerol-3-phosphate acyltransferase
MPRLGAPEDVSADAAGDVGGSATDPSPADPSPADPSMADPLGGQLDPAFVERLRRGVFRFLHDVWWRVDVHGLERLPAEGGAVLLGVHRGIVPFDAMMLLHDAVGATGRVPRFLVHRGLLRFGPIGRVIRGLGGLEATRENGERVVAAGEMLGIFPEGAAGAFSLRRDADRLQRTGRPEYVRWALRYGVPIIPFVTVGSADVFPVLHQFHWKWWKRLTQWPCLPITPTFPVLPLPLPAKWHTWILEPFPLAQHPASGAADPSLVRAIAEEVEGRLASALTWMTTHRPGIFGGKIFGAAFDEDAAWREARQIGSSSSGPA